MHPLSQGITLITGVVGFIGFHLAKSLLLREHRVLGIDNINDYYDIRLKEERLRYLKNLDKDFYFFKLDISDIEGIKRYLGKYYGQIEHIVNLAGQSGVRYSTVNPFAYIRSNVSGQVSLLDMAKNLNNLKTFIYASSSSVYGRNRKLPFTENDKTSKPASIYAASKLSMENFTESYSFLFNIPIIGLRLFTVYGSWGRPDMALFKFTKSIIENKPIEIYNKGRPTRSFTHVDDVINRVLFLLTMTNNKTKAERLHSIYNLGNPKSYSLSECVEFLEQKLRKEAIKVYKPLPKEDVVNTSCNDGKIKDLCKQVNYIDLEKGIEEFINWYKDFYFITR